MQDIFEEVFQYLRGIWLKRRYILIATDGVFSMDGYLAN